MAKKFDLSNDKVNIEDYGLKGEDVYNIAKNGKKSVTNDVRLSAANMLVDILKNGDGENLSYEESFFVTMFSDLLTYKNKAFKPVRQDLVSTIDNIVETNGEFSLELWVATKKIMDTFIKTRN